MLFRSEFNNKGKKSELIWSKKDAKRMYAFAKEECGTGVTISPLRKELKAFLKNYNSLSKMGSESR